jgi:hypothetical protein
MAVRREPAVRFFTESTRRLGEHAAAAGVRHHIVLSIVGIDRVRTGYYLGKLAQERVARDGAVPVTVQRATQFHELARHIIRRATFGPLALVPAMRIQPIAAAAVAVHLADLAEGPPLGRAPDLGGPQPDRLPVLARALMRAQPRRALVVPVPIPGPAGRAIRKGGLLLGVDGVVRGPSFVDWLASQER